MTESIGAGLTRHETFRQYLPDAKIISITKDLVPFKIMEHFESHSKLSNEEYYRLGNFSEFYLVMHSDDSKTFLARQTKTYDTNRDTEEVTYLVDIDKQNVHVGHGEIRWNISNKSDFFKNRPLVGYTETYQDYRKQGLGLRRLLVMNAVSEMLYGLPLNSDILSHDNQERRWKRLVEQGKAIVYKQGTFYRYVFV
jgi:hypothetical protein